MAPTLANLAKTLKALPRVAAQQIAARAAERLTDLALAGYAAQRNPYGAAWGDGNDLVETGKLRGKVRYKATGPVVKVSLGTKYARYHATKILPGKVLPAAWVDVIADIAAEEIKKAAG